MAGFHVRLGDRDGAKAGVAHCVALKPNFSIAHFMSKERLKMPADAEHLASSLRMAGLPE